MSNANQKIMTKGMVGSDDYQTPLYAIEPLSKYIPKKWIVWEPAQGKGNIRKFFRSKGYKCFGSDINNPVMPINFLKEFPPHPIRFNCIVTNPPYSKPNRDNFIRRCYEIGKPFALLLPVTSLASIPRQNMYREYGLQIIMLGRRVHFETEKKLENGAWFETAWFTWGLDLPRDIIFETMKIPKDK